MGKDAIQDTQDTDQRKEQLEGKSEVKDRSYAEERLVHNAKDEKEDKYNEL